MPFSTRPFLRSLVQSFVTYNAGPFFKLPLTYFLGFGSCECQEISSTGLPVSSFNALPNAISPAS